MAKLDRFENYSRHAAMMRRLGASEAEVQRELAHREALLPAQERMRTDELAALVAWAARGGPIEMSPEPRCGPGVREAAGEVQAGEGREEA